MIVIGWEGISCTICKLFYSMNLYNQNTLLPRYKGLILLTQKLMGVSFERLLSFVWVLFSSVKLFQVMWNKYNLSNLDKEFITGSALWEDLRKNLSNSKTFRTSQRNLSTSTSANLDPLFGNLCRNRLINTTPKIV